MLFGRNVFNIKILPTILLLLQNFKGSSLIWNDSRSKILNLRFSKVKQSSPQKKHSFCYKRYEVWSLQLENYFQRSEPFSRGKETLKMIIQNDCVFFIPFL